MRDLDAAGTAIRPVKIRRTERGCRAARNLRLRYCGLILPSMIGTKRELLRCVRRHGRNLETVAVRILFERTLIKALIGSAEKLLSNDEQNSSDSV